MARVAEALAAAGADFGPAARRFLARMIAEAERPRIEKLIFGPEDGA